MAPVLSRANVADDARCLGRGAWRCWHTQRTVAAARSEVQTHTHTHARASRRAASNAILGDGLRARLSQGEILFSRVGFMHHFYFQFIVFNTAKSKTDTAGVTWVLSLYNLDKLKNTLRAQRVCTSQIVRSGSAAKKENSNCKHRVPAHSTHAGIGRRQRGWRGGKGYRQVLNKPTFTPNKKNKSSGPPHTFRPNPQM